MRRVLSLFLPNFPTDRLHLRGASPETALTEADTRPLLTAARQGARRVVMAADARAQSLGVQAGMAVAHAQAMLPDLRLEEADPAGDEAALQRLAGWCLRHVSPLAAPCADGVVIDVTGCTHLFGGETALLAQLTRRLRQAGYSARAAIAATPGAAHALSHYGSIDIAPPGSPPGFFADLPVAALRLPEEMVHSLQRLGFETVGALQKAPRAPLAKRFGTLLAMRLDQLLGHVAEPIEPILIPEIPRARLSFPDPIATPEDLARAVKLLCDRICEKCLQRGIGISQLDLIFMRVDGAAPALRIGTAQANRDPAHLSRLLIEKLETIDPGFGIEQMLLAASFTGRLEARQAVSDLCTDPGAIDLASLVDTLTNRLGQKNVFRLSPVQSDVPERAVRRTSPLARAEHIVWPSHLPRPPRLITPPQRITVLALLPDHAPRHFVWRKRSYRVRCADGPERVFGEWWRNDKEISAVRDYFSVEEEAGQRFWLFRHGDGEYADTGDMAWYLHGLFG